MLLRSRRAYAVAWFALALVPLAGRAADVRYDVSIAGRPLDSSGGSAIVHGGVAFVNIVRVVKAFSGLLTFHRSGAVRVAVGQHTMTFYVGRRTALLDGTTTIALRGAPFVLQAETYVPVAAVAALTGATFTVDRKVHAIDFELDARPASLQASTAAPEAEPKTDDDDMRPSPAIALAFLPSATADAAGLHARVDIVNRTPNAYSVSFPGGTQIAFIVARDGNEIWNSSAGEPATRASTLTIPAHQTHTETADWPGYAKRGAGRYTLRVRLLTTAPLDSSAVSLGVATPAPIPAAS